MLLITTLFFSQQLLLSSHIQMSKPAQWARLRRTMAKSAGVAAKSPRHSCFDASRHNGRCRGQIRDTNEPFLVMTRRDVEEPLNILRCSVTDFYFGLRLHSAQHLLICTHLDDHFVSPACRSAAAKQMKHPQNKRVPLQASGCLLVVELISVFYL